jgi:hypothetical protein
VGVAGNYHTYKTNKTDKERTKKGEFPGFCKTGFGVGYNGCAIVRQGIEDMFY